MSRTKRRKNHLPAVKAQYVNQYKESGLSVRQYCQEHDLVRQTFYSWLKLGKQKLNGPSMQPAKNFLRMKITDNADVRDIYAEVSYPDGKVVRFFQEVDAAQISLLLKVS